MKFFEITVKDTHSHEDWREDFPDLVDAVGRHVTALYVPEVERMYLYVRKDRPDIYLRILREMHDRCLWGSFGATLRDEDYQHIVRSYADLDEIAPVVEWLLENELSFHWVKCPAAQRVWQIGFKDATAYSMYRLVYD